MIMALLFIVNIVQVRILNLFKLSISNIDWEVQTFYNGHRIRDQLHAPLYINLSVSYIRVIENHKNDCERLWHIILFCIHALFESFRENVWIG